MKQVSAPSLAPLREVGSATFSLADLDPLGTPNFEEKDVEAYYKQFGLPPGPERTWWLEAQCGLEFVLSQDFFTEGVRVIAEETAEFEHVLAHLPFPAEEAIPNGALLRGADAAPWAWRLAGPAD
ncbi:hypothetical protein D7Y21_01055 [Corallococcus sp. AB045]|uniref:hypothetical protein n=1 Tax=Corallococcus sp. AB045 TaxID=2316719 RepID=UPI000ED74295|nr:hypothetical protein [Corallococcus sp. AB045]RKH91806.1 hypothetical protein D7Y21_01055 [Corallococcus sp. AB045]